jgi:hypothetical protein
VANDNEVIVSPITGSGSSSSVIALAQQLAAGTDGVHFSSSVPDADIAEGIYQLILDACLLESDCNENGLLDECEVANGDAVDFNGNGIPDECEYGVSDAGTPGRPLGLARLNQNTPNPFNPVTVISFELARPALAELTVYAVDGSLVATLLAENLPAGLHEAVWRGCDDRGRKVSSGVYFYHLKAGSYQETKRMVMIR